MKNFVNNLKFSESGVRGIVGNGLTPKLLGALAASFGEYLSGGKVLIGRDTRPSGEMFELSVISGLLSVGCEVINLGVIPTPTLQLMVNELKVKGAIAITASHNPYSYNALKFIGGDGCFLDKVMSDELFDIYSQGDLPFVEEQQLRTAENFNNAFEIHKDKIFNSGINIEAIRKRRFKVAIDCCNGVGALYSENLLRALGCEVFAINNEPDGIFRRTPEPVPDALGELSRTIIEHGCDIGFAQDPDGDRLTVADNSGKVLSQHYTLALAIEHSMEDSCSDVVVINLQSSRMVEDVIKSYGGKVIFCKVGEINCVSAMKKYGAEIGGEGNCGGVIYSKVNYGRDSFSAMTLLLEMLSVSDSTLSEIVATLPAYVNYNTKFPASALAARFAVEKLTERYKNEKILTLDGLKIDFENGWVLIRSSNTERILRLDVESKSENDAKRLLVDFSNQIKQLLEQKD